ncbi:MAG: imidazole glycerol phosphate synthase subunit HisF, partial [Pseudomonadales bacterium]|nr:imidazole glycerol phosphate synthase subunit HisF [Pseudomonadales bacterium]
MREPRVIPMLTLMGEGLYRTIGFKKPVYVGDPINAVKLFNDKEVDELIIADISTDRDSGGIQYQLLEDLATEAFMPMAYAGRIASVAQAERLFRIGYEKIVLNTAALDYDLIGDLAARFGTQSCVVSIDVGKPRFGKLQVMVECGRRKTGLDPIEHLARCQSAGAGEIILRSIAKDGTMSGYDLDLITRDEQVAEV